MDRRQTRRKFLKVSGGLAAAGTLGGAGLLSACSGKGGAEEAAGSKPFGLQLYTLRDVLPSDPQGVLKQVAAFGYDQIESYEGGQGMFWGMGAEGFRSYVEALGMSVVSSHVGNFTDFESFRRKADEAAGIGMSYLICPYAKRNSLDEYKALADAFNQAGEIAKAAGIQFAYHNHDYSFREVEGVYPQALFMERTDPELVEYEMDIYWVVFAGEDPLAWLKRYEGRFTLSHVKDLSRAGETQSTTLGQGEIEWPPLLSQARELGMSYFIVEQEQYAGTTPLEATRENARYLSSIRF